MNSKQIKSWRVISLMALILTLPGWVAAQTGFNGIVVFGTSLSDPGNIFALTGEQSISPYNTLDQLLIPTRLMRRAVTTSATAPPGSNRSRGH
jgi:hypothetical protein